MKKRLKLKKEGRIFFGIIFLFSSFLFIYPLSNIFYWFKDNQKTDNQVKEIIEKVEVTEIKDNDNTEIIIQEKEEPINSPYWNYIKTPLISVDFNELKEINSETVGWINLPGTNINYPFVQTKDNDYYLNHSFDKTNNRRQILQNK